jgi:hypothetical protein
MKRMRGIKPKSRNATHEAHEKARKERDLRMIDLHSQGERHSRFNSSIFVNFGVFRGFYFPL